MSISSRQFAVQVVQDLQSAGHQALWAGGCVRDQLLNLDPKDYDVATSATPDQVRALFGHSRTIPVGAAFGVITVLGPRSAEPIEVATFRRDSGYSDGRRPDHVEFTDAREDALRRDFTINGMFYDPVHNQVIDFVEGQEDLNAGRVRAIGDPEQRIDEDKLRMLRGVRFAATFSFSLDPATRDAIERQSGSIRLVSAERIGSEMRRMLVDSQRAMAVELLRHTGLLAEIIDQSELLWADDTEWRNRLAALQRLETNCFSSAASLLLQPILAGPGLRSVVNRWRLANYEQRSIRWIDDHWDSLLRARQLPWSQLQPLLVSEFAGSALSVAAAMQPDSEDVWYCSQKLELPDELLNPPWLITGDDLFALGVPRGPLYKTILEAIRNEQLDGDLASVDQAKARALDLAGPGHLPQGPGTSSPDH